MSEMHDRSGMVWRGLVALGVAVGMSIAAGLAGRSFGVFERMPEGFERNFYTYGFMALATAAILLVIIGGSWLFVRVKAGGGIAATVDKAKDGNEAAQQKLGLKQHGSIFMMIPIFYIFISTLDRIGDVFTGLLALDHQPFALMFALGVTPIMGVLAIAERPEGARIKWRTVFFTAALWPAALLADLIGPTAASYEGPARYAVAYSSIVVMVGWIALGGALGTLDLMFSLANPRAYEERLKGIAPLAEGWSLWHGVPFLLLVFSMRWQHGWNGIPEIAGNPLYFAEILAAATVALSRPRSSHGWVLAGLAGTAVAVLLLGGAATAGHIIELSDTIGPAAGLAIYLLFAVPGIAAAVVAVWRLTIKRGGSAGPRDERQT